MGILLGKEVRITNSKLIRWADQNDIKMDALEKLKITQVIDLICACSDLTHEEIDNELDNDMNFSVQLAEVLNESLELKAGGEPVKRTAKPGRK
ncbi:MAG TPA: hypothetical protein PLV12_02910 [Saprospiraceae bacterium]|jgi:hypothetical protein|nr:hypothetical protein [Saprospiraceae bacterium]